MKLAIIGAGWAGLAAAVQAAERGVAVTLFEAGRVAGGRARGVAAEEGFSFCDNGQHLLIGGYAGVLGFLRRLGVDVARAFVRVPMQWHLVDGVRFQAAFLPKPLNILSGIAFAQNATLPEKWALCRDVQQLLSWQRAGGADKTVADFLVQRRVSAKWRDEFWQPMVWGALNTPLETASLRVLAHVLNDGAGSNFLIPNNDLGKLLVEPALAKLGALGGRFVPQTRVGRLAWANQKIIVENEVFDRVIVAVAPYHLAGLLPEKSWGAVQAAVQSWHYHAITTVYLRYENALQLPVLMTGFAHGTAQWLIDRSRVNGRNELAAVISFSEQHGRLSAAEWAARVHADVLRVAPHAGLPVASKVITEKRATVAATPNRAMLPQKSLNENGIFVAGDYLSERYPATLEAAVQSGVMAANAALLR